jgi:hypothetical protein
MATRRLALRLKWASGALKAAVNSELERNTREWIGLDERSTHRWVSVRSGQCTDWHLRDRLSSLCHVHGEVDFGLLLVP